MTGAAGDGAAGAAGRHRATTGSIWWVEWRRALRRRRLFLLNVAIPLALVAPIAWSTAPPAHASAVYAVLLVLFATFGSAIPLLRDAESGILRRIVLTGVGPRAHLLERAAASALLDLIQLLPALGAILLAARGGGVAALVLFLVLGPSLLVAALVGWWVAALARSIAEGALFAAVAALLLLHASGVFRTPAPGTVAASVEALAPFRALHESLLAAAAGTGGIGAASIVVFAGGLVVVAAGSAFFAPRLLSRLARAG